MQYKLFPSERFSFFSLSSGSCGNCYYLGNSYYGILIDAGIGPRIIKKRLAEYGVDISTIMAVLITHDHYDHIFENGTGRLSVNDVNRQAISFQGNVTAN
jgi:glyoxylase-like metal-dependent hydrolase (beta-lactamase superfamily II)